LLVTKPSGFERFMRSVGEPAERPARGLT
jgi:hypothetical protein